MMHYKYLIQQLKHPTSITIQAAMCKFGNLELAVETDWDELPDTPFQRWLEQHEACLAGRFAVGTQTVREFWARQIELYDINLYLVWLVQQTVGWGYYEDNSYYYYEDECCTKIEAELT